MKERSVSREVMRMNLNESLKIFQTLRELITIKKEFLTSEANISSNTLEKAELMACFSHLV